LPSSDPQTGDVYYYPYIWKRQQGGSAVAEKDRPCCVVLRLKTGALNGENTFILALSQSGVPEDGFGVVVPREIIQGLKRLDSTVKTFLITSEHNRDVADRECFNEGEYLGSIPLEFLKPVLREMIDHLRLGSGGISQKST